MVFVSKMRRRWNMLKTGGFLQALATFSLIALCAVVIAFVNATELSIRVGGLILQMAGMGLVIYGLNKTLQEFGEKSIFSRIWSWLVNFYKGEARYVHGEGSAQLVCMIGIQGDFRLAPVAKEATLEDRLRRLEGGMDALIPQVRGDRIATYGELDRIRNELKGEVKGRKQELGALSAQVHRVHADGAGLTLMGTVWLVVGVVLGALPGELSRFLVKQMSNGC